jgi:hypothetical protein
MDKKELVSITFGANIIALVGVLLALFTSIMMIIEPCNCDNVTCPIGGMLTIGFLLSSWVWYRVPWICKVRNQ